ncbi:MAG: hypothetical protein C4576_35760 [Desulfobacteraceae bacterium]|nr:MAG: hypothetical protein C4576_35760 [Desulfobacteraceae bacterium]
MITYIVRVYRRAGASQDRAAGIAVDPETGKETPFSNAQELWSIINGESFGAPLSPVEDECPI